MNSYLVIILGCLIGMAAAVAVQSTIIHRSKKYSINFKEAMAFYFKQSTGQLVVGGIVVLAFMYIYPEVMKKYDSITEENPIKYQRYIEAMVEDLRFLSLGIGAFGQALGFLIIGIGRNKLKQIEQDVSKSAKDKSDE